jgi:NADH-quinone oxidoreductase subunit M
VEAPTGGSVILAGLLLKLGGYGFLRVLLPIFSQSTFLYLPLIDMLALVSIIYASLTTIRQVDLKRIIAYSSVAHMNLVVLGLFSVNLVGMLGGIFLMIAHGIVASALFFSIGVLYDRYASRLLFYYGGLVNTMPLFSCLLLIFSLANTGLPSTVNFIGELVIFIGLVDHNIVVLFISISSVVFSVLYTIFMFNRLVFGNINGQYITSFMDINTRELLTLGSLAFLTIFLGICPNFIFQNLEASTSLIIEKLK